MSQQFVFLLFLLPVAFISSSFSRGKVAFSFDAIFRERASRSSPQPPARPSPRPRPRPRPALSVQNVLFYGKDKEEGRMVMRQVREGEWQGRKMDKWHGMVGKGRGRVGWEVTSSGTTLFVAGHCQATVSRRPATVKKVPHHHCRKPSVTVKTVIIILQESGSFRPARGEGR